MKQLGFSRRQYREPPRLSPFPQRKLAKGIHISLYGFPKLGMDIHLWDCNIDILQANNLRITPHLQQKHFENHSIICSFAPEIQNITFI